VTAQLGRLVAGFACLTALFAAGLALADDPLQTAQAQPVAPKDAPEQPKDKASAPPRDDILNLDIERLGSVPARVNVASGFNAPVTTVGRERDVAAAAPSAQ